MENVQAIWEDKTVNILQKNQNGTKYEQIMIFSNGEWLPRDVQPAKKNPEVR